MNMRDVPAGVLGSASHPASGPADDVASIPAAAVPLSDLDVGAFATIHAVLPTADEADQDLVLRLIEIGFIPGERVRIVAVGRPGRQPLAVRLAAADSGRRNLNGATFALRRHEADLIRVVPDAATATRGSTAATIPATRQPGPRGA